MRTFTLSTVIAVLGLLSVACSATSESETPTQGTAYGTNAELDSLYDSCESGDDNACESLFWAAPADTEYEAFAVTCGGTKPDAAKPARCGPEPTPNSEPSDIGTGETYGNDPALDALWDSCEAGDNDACDDLFFDSPVGSGYEEFGATCGQRFALSDAPIFCAESQDTDSTGGDEGNNIAGLDGSGNDGSGGLASEPFGYGDDAGFDALWDQCVAEDFEACDELFLTSPIDSDYELFGGTCGERFTQAESPFSCDVELGDGATEPADGAFTYGDDPTFDGLWDACDAGDGEACDTLFFSSPVGSEYEAFGNTCGYRFDEASVPFSCVGET